jgi:hypothetical protein
LAGDPVFNTIDHYRKGIKTMKAKIKLSPSLPVLTAQVVLPKSVVAAIDRRADANFRSRSEVIRSIILDRLRSDGIIATEEEMAS